MAIFPPRLRAEMVRLNGLSRTVMSPAESAAYREAEAKLDERIDRYNRTLARQQMGVNELVWRGEYAAVKCLMAMHDMANAQARF